MFINFSFSVHEKKSGYYILNILLLLLLLPVPKFNILPFLTTKNEETYILIN